MLQKNRRARVRSLLNPQDQFGAWSALRIFSTRLLFFFFLMTGHPPKSPLFPYTTLFRSGWRPARATGGLVRGAAFAHRHKMLQPVECPFHSSILWMESNFD